MFGIGGFELFIILVFGFLIFGPDKLPDIANTVGKGIARFREAQQEMNEAIGDEKIFDPNNPDEPFKNPVDVLDKLAQKQEEKRSAGKAASDAASPTSARKEGGARRYGPPAQKREPDSSSAQAARDGSPASGGEAGRDLDDQPRQESFTERKARYERERAARKAAERAAAEGDGAVGAKSAEKPSSSEGSAPNSSEGGQDKPAVPTGGDA